MVGTTYAAGVPVRGYQGAGSNKLTTLYGSKKTHRAHDLYREEAARRGDGFFKFEGHQKGGRRTPRQEDR